MSGHTGHCGVVLCRPGGHVTSTQGFGYRTPRGSRGVTGPETLLRTRRQASQGLLTSCGSVTFSVWFGDRGRSGDYDPSRGRGHVSEHPRCPGSQDEAFTIPNPTVKMVKSVGATFHSFSPPATRQWHTAVLFPTPPTRVRPGMPTVSPREEDKTRGY